MATRKKKTSRDAEPDEPVRKSRKSSSGTSRRTSSRRTKETSSGRSVIPIDFSKDESEGGRKRYPEGDYHVKYVAFKTGSSSDKGTPYVRPTFLILEGKYKGNKLTDDLYLTDKSLWRLRNFLEAMGVTIPKKKVNVDFKKYIGKELGVTLGDDEYQGRIRSRVTDFLDLDTLRGVDEDDEDFDDEDADEEDEDEDEDEDEEDEDDDDEDDDDMEEMDVDDDL